MLSVIINIKTTISNYELITGREILPARNWANQFEFYAQTFKQLNLERTPVQVLEDMNVKLLSHRRLALTMI